MYMCDSRITTYMTHHCVYKCSVDHNTAAFTAASSTVQ